MEIIPILHFGVVPFLAAYSNPHSFVVFNQVVAAGPTGREAVVSLNAGQEPLLLRSLCFMAMIGEPSTALRSPSLDLATFHAPVPTLQFVDKGRARQVFSIRNSERTYQIWTLTFTQEGRLLTAQPEEHNIRSESPSLQATAPLPALPTSPQSSTLPQPGATEASQTPVTTPTPAIAPARPAASAPVVTPSPSVASAPSSAEATRPGSQIRAVLQCRLTFNKRRSLKIARSRHGARPSLAPSS